MKKISLWLCPAVCLFLVLAGCRPVTRIQVPAPPELSIEEHALTQRPEAEYTQLNFAEGAQESILSRHAVERAQINSFMDRSCNVENHFGQCATLGTERLFAWDEYTSGLFHTGSVMLTRNGSRIYKIPIGDSSPISGLRGLWTYGNHWVLETARVTNQHIGNMIDSQATGQISVDGKLLNQQLEYQEAFGFQTMNGRPFYFFKLEGKIGVSYNNVAIPLRYSEVPHYGCCSASTLNPHVSQNMVAFFARKGNTWYYVEAGVFGQAIP